MRMWLDIYYATKSVLKERRIYQNLPRQCKRFDRKTLILFLCHARVARGCRIWGQQALLDIRVFDSKRMPILRLILNLMLYNQQKRKICNYNQRNMEVEQGSFSTLVFIIYGGMGRECQAFYTRLTELLLEKGEVINNAMHSIKYLLRIIKILHPVFIKFPFVESCLSK